MPEFERPEVGKPRRPHGPHHLLAWLLSVPERILRWVAGLLGSCLRTLTWIVPRQIRDGRFYKTAVERQIKMLTDDVGQAALFKDQPELSARSAARLGVGGAIDNLLILSLHASPVWVLLAATDVCKGAQSFVSEIGEELKDAGVMDADSRLDNVDDVLKGLSRLSERMADTVDMPPISLDEMKSTVSNLKDELGDVVGSGINVADVEGLINDVRSTASETDRSLLQTTAAVATGTLHTTGNVIVGAAIGTTATLRFVGRNLSDTLSDYGRSAQRIRRLGFYGSIRSFLRPHTRTSSKLFAFGFVTYTELLLSGWRWSKAEWRV